MVSKTNSEVDFSPLRTALALHPVTVQVVYEDGHVWAVVANRKNGRRVHLTYVNTEEQAPLEEGDRETLLSLFSDQDVELTERIGGQKGNNCGWALTEQLAQEIGEALGSPLFPQSEPAQVMAHSERLARQLAEEAGIVDWRRLQTDVTKYGLGPSQFAQFQVLQDPNAITLESLNASLTQRSRGSTFGRREFVNEKQEAQHHYVMNSIREAYNGQRSSHMAWCSSENSLSFLEMK